MASQHIRVQAMQTSPTEVPMGTYKRRDINTNYKWLIYNSILKKEERSRKPRQIIYQATSGPLFLLDPVPHPRRQLYRRRLLGTSHSLD